MLYYEPIQAFQGAGNIGMMHQSDSHRREPMRSSCQFRADLCVHSSRKNIGQLIILLAVMCLTTACERIRHDSDSAALVAVSIARESLLPRCGPDIEIEIISSKKIVIEAVNDGQPFFDIRLEVSRGHTAIGETYLFVFDSFSIAGVRFDDYEFTLSRVRC